MDFRNEIESHLGPLGKFAGLKPFANRGAEQALRLATVLGYFEGIEQIDGDCIRRACKLVRYSLSEWLRYTDAGTVDPDLQKAAYLICWLRDPKRTEKWHEFHVNDLGKSGPAAIRSAKVRDRVLAILVRHNQLLTEDGKQFRLNHLAETADYAEIPQPQGFTVAGNLRNPSESSLLSSRYPLGFRKLPQVFRKLKPSNHATFRNIRSFRSPCRPWMPMNIGSWHCERC